MTQPALAPGQAWSIKSEIPTSTKVVIGRIEPLQHHVVVHVSIIDIPNMDKLTAIDHMPFDQPSLATSLDQLLGTGAAPAPNFETGYKQWRDANGGFFTISVSEAIKVVFEAVNKPRS